MRRPLPLLTLSAADRAALLQVRDHAAKPYLRESAAALLKLADGATIQDVAARGLHKARARHTVARWLNRYLAGGLAALRVHPGRGRKPAFSPSGTRRGQDRVAPSPHP